MLTYWLDTPVPSWCPLMFAIGFAILAALAVSTTLMRRAWEPNANRIATLYAVGFGLVALSEFMMYLNLAFGWSLAAALAMTAGTVTVFVVAAIVVAVLVVGIAFVMQYREEAYQMTHGLSH